MRRVLVFALSIFSVHPDVKAFLLLFNANIIEKSAACILLPFK